MACNFHWQHLWDAIGSQSESIVQVYSSLTSWLDRSGVHGYGLKQLDKHQYAIIIFGVTGYTECKNSNAAVYRIHFVLCVLAVTLRSLLVSSFLTNNIKNSKIC